MIKKVAVASRNKRNAIGHAGSCQSYFIYNIDAKGKYTKELKELAEDETLHHTFHNKSSSNQKNYLFDMDYIIVTKIGLNGVKKLAKQNVTALIIDRTESTDEVINSFLADTLVTYEAQPKKCNCTNNK